MAPDERNHTYYDVLGLPRTCSEEEMRKTYLDIVRTLHPDKSRRSASGTDRFHEVQAAWRCLSDPTRRLMYDLRTFGDSSSSGASGASPAEMGEVLMRRLKEQAALDLRNSEVELQRILQREQKRHGILIKQALYGNLQLRKELLPEVLKGQRPIRIEDITGPWIDVTSAVQCLVEHCRIRLYGSSKFSKADLPGFYNPMPLSEQVELSLYVLYSFKDALHEVTVEDSEDLQLPWKRHWVKDQPRGPFPSSNIPLIFERRWLGANVQTPNATNAMSPRQRIVGGRRIKSREEELYWAIRQHVFLRLVGQGDIKREFHLVLLCASTAALAILWALRS